MDYFSEIYGLVTEWDSTSENGGLFLSHYVVYNPSWRGLDIYNKKMTAAKQPNGLYARSANHLKRSVSNDEISGMMVTSYVYKTLHRFEIWKQLLKNLGAYPAVVMEFSDKLPYNPANYYAWGQFAESKLSYLFLPFYFINLMICLSKEKQNTSSKLIYNTELKTLPKTFINKLLKKYLDKKLTKMYGDNFVKEMMNIYFHTEKPEFPLFQVVNE